MNMPIFGRRHRLRTTSSAIALLMLGLPATAMAQAATELPPVPVDTVQDQPAEAAFGGGVLAGKDLRAKKATAAGTADLLKDIPGVSLYTNGGQSALPVMHGLADDRNKVLVDGMPITSACPNHMNPALSYIEPSAVTQVEAIAGITPVSMGGDSIGGTIAVQSADPVFARTGEGVHTEGSMTLRARSNNRSFGQALTGVAATEDFSARYHADHDKASAYHDGNGNRIMASGYERVSHDLTLGAKAGDNVFTLQGGQKYTPYEGFPNEYMDMLWNRSNFVNGRWQGGFSWGDVDSRVYYQNVQHYMNFLGDRVNYTGGAGMPMYTEGTDMGYSVKATLPVNKRDTFRVGNELHRYTLDDWWPAIPNNTTTMGPNTFWNVADGERTVLGTYGEWDAKWTPQWSTLFGVRNDLVFMDTGDVSPYSRTNTAGVNYTTDSTRFNAQDRSKVDVNWDLTALTRYEATQTNTLDLGYARKSRSPNLYERYAWSTGTMAMRMVNWFGDGNGYVGNVNLKPEVAHTFSMSSEWHDAGKKNWRLKFTPYYTYIQDYIGVDRINNGVANPAYTAGTNNNIPIALLRFANHDAQVYGFDISGQAGLWDDTGYGSGLVKGYVGLTRGEQINTGNSLYHMLPVNADITLEHKLGGWTNSIETKLMASKTRTDPTRMEKSTPGYALINLRSGYDWENVGFTLGVDNLFDKQYYDPLGGVDISDARAKGRQTQFESLGAMGRTFIAEMTVKF
ncbi:MAG: TonB-dependent receptor [Bacteroidales bacterium]